MFVSGRFTVAICTWNRAALLDQTLASMRQLRIPPGLDWELVVVNNNCTDETDAVIARHADQLPLRRLWEPQPGQCHARNRAIDESRGEVIVWTDDDVLVDRGCLASYSEAVAAHPEAGFFGGPIHPWFESDPPRWLTEVWPLVKSAYAIRDFGDAAFPFQSNRLPFGANYAVRMEVQRRYRYDPNLGLKPGRTLRGDEINVLLRMLLDGVCGQWVPNAAVQHYIPVERQTIGYLRGYYFGQGECRAQESRSNGAACPAWCGRPRWLWRSALQNELSFRLRKCLLPPEKWISALIDASIAWGDLAGRESDDRLSQKIRRFVCGEK